MDLPAPLAWLVDEASASTGPDRFRGPLSLDLKFNKLFIGRPTLV